MNIEEYSEIAANISDDFTAFSEELAAVYDIAPEHIRSIAAASVVLEASYGILDNERKPALKLV